MGKRRAGSQIGYMSQNKTFTRNLQTLEKISCTNLKFGLKLVGLSNNSL
jgi:hypothetical protein